MNGPKATTGVRLGVRDAARWALAAAALSAAVGAQPSEAAAYCRTASCGDVTGTRCEPPEPDDCGIPIFWPGGCVGFSIQEDASSQVSLADAERVFENAFATWMQADCSGSRPALVVKNLGPVACDQHEYNQSQELGNANAIIFRDDGWDHGGTGSTLALTTVTFNLDTGEIYDADMELNSHQNEFSIGDDDVTFDLWSIATHEAGHFLGLSHARAKEATMFADYVPGSTSLRDLAADDIAAICAVYAPENGPIPDSCDASPRHGLASECSSPPGAATQCCTTAPGAPSRGDGAAFALALGVLALAARRRG